MDLSVMLIPTPAVPQLDLWWVLLAPLFPFLGFLLLAFLPQGLRNKLRFAPIAGLALSFFIAVAAALSIWPGGPINESFYRLSWDLATLGSFPLTVSFAVDSLAVLMLLMVSFVGLCVQVYSLQYMKDDPRIGWFFCIKSLFLAAMLAFVLSGGLLLQFAFWEIMGLCSWALIGFWYKNKAPRKASQKAFLFTRAGDVGFFVALSAVFVAAQSFEFSAIFASAPDWSPFVLTVVVLGLIWAAIGKSAQFPLSVWLPDAMAGPTPGSALIHAATMVIAGVFMLLRMLPVIELSPLAMNIILAVGIITAIYGALLACFQNDLKKVLAFSTISQLGFLFAVIGVGSAFVAVFHLTTHAFFKALLFLAAGVIIHATGTQDMRKMGGLVRTMPITFIVFTIGAFALAGVAPLAGFFSKDEIFKAMLYFGQESGQYLALAGVLLVGVLTAFYVMKSWLSVFFAKAEDKADSPELRAAQRKNEKNYLEMVPLVALAFPAALLGLAVIPLGNFLAYPSQWPPLYMVALSTIVMLTGAALGYLAYLLVQKKRSAVGSEQHSDDQKMAKSPFRFVLAAADQRFYLDAFYDYLIIKPYIWLTKALWYFDERVLDAVVDAAAWIYQKSSQFLSWLDAHVIDGLVNAAAWVYVLLARLMRVFDVRVVDGIVKGIGHLSISLGSHLKSIQSGEVQWYQRLVIGATVIVLGILVVYSILQGGA